jgi:hypothetical protein
MAVPIEFLRGVLGVICIGCAYMTGRSLGAVRKGWSKPSKLYAWILRMTVCLAGVAFRHPVDLVDIAIWVLAAAAFAGALWDVSRTKKTEDLTSTMFPPES